MTVDIVEHDRYVEDKPLSLPAARQLAAREANERKRDWLGVNVHKAWVKTDGGVGGGGVETRALEFGRASGREEVRALCIVFFLR